MKRIAVVPYDPLWPQAFAVASEAVASALGGNLLEIHHIGSTAIPGIHAKPIIDMLAIVSDIAAIDQCVAQMKSLGYEAMGEFGIAGRRYFRRDNLAGDRTHQVHTYQNGSPHNQRHLAFRDFLRSHPELSGQYGELKRRLAAAHPNDMEAYMDGKDSFIKETEATAVEWVASGGGLPACLRAPCVTTAGTDQRSSIAQRNMRGSARTCQ
jgi:GrpB-like predicted nucleotidyltransferase (UPF0157 family)